MQQLDNPQPVCANCTTPMSKRDGNRHFCPGCAEYARNLPTIRPESPQHPTFEQRLKEDPQLAVGLSLIKSEYKDEYGESVGIIDEYNESVERFTIQTDLEEPFRNTIRYIGLEQMLGYLWVSDYTGRPNPPEKLHLRLE